MKAAHPKRMNIIRLTTNILVIGILVTALASLHQAITWKALCILRYMAMALPLCLIADAIWHHFQIRQSPDQGLPLTSVSVDITCLLPISVISYMIVSGLIPFQSWPWVLALTVTVLPLAVAVAHGQLNAQEPSMVLVKSSLLALVAGLLTWGQISLAHHQHAWLFVRVGILPIPLLALTILITSVAAVYAVAVLFSASVFYPLRTLYMKRQRK